MLLHSSLEVLPDIGEGKTAIHPWGKGDSSLLVHCSLLLSIKNLSILMIRLFKFGGTPFDHINSLPCFVCL